MYEEQTVAGASQFTGGVGAGLVTFSEVTVIVDRLKRAIIKSLTYQSAGAAHQIDGVLRRPAAGATVAQVLAEIASGNSRTISCGQGGLVVPRTETGVSFELFWTTVGKAGDGTLIVDWEIESVTEGG